MCRFTWSGRGVLAAALLLLTFGFNAGAAEEKAEQKALDSWLRKSLFYFIDEGAAQHNSGNVQGCHKTFEDALKGILPLLNHHPEIQQNIKDGMAAAEKLPSLEARSFKLREVLDKVRADLKPGGAEKPKVDPPKIDVPKVDPPKIDVPKVDPPKATAWERLGGEAGVKKIVADFVESAAKDPKVNFDRNGKYKLDDATLGKVKTELVKQFSYLNQGPYKPEKDAVPAYKGLGITDAEFDAAAAHLRKALETNKVSAEDVRAIQFAVGGLRNVVVEPKLPDPPKLPDLAKDGVVQGKVSLEGAPLAGGRIGFVGADKKTLTGEITADGSYKVTGVKPGKYKIVVEGNDKVGALFSLPETTSLEGTVVKEMETMDLELKPKK